MKQKVIVPNCIFFDKYSPDGVPIGGVQCSRSGDCEYCLNCGFNPNVSEKRLKRIVLGIRSDGK